VHTGIPETDYFPGETSGAHFGHQDVEGNPPMALPTSLAEPMAIIIVGECASDPSSRVASPHAKKVTTCDE
jgi:hypothetical protein